MTTINDPYHLYKPIHVLSKIFLINDNFETKSSINSKIISATFVGLMVMALTILAMKDIHTMHDVAYSAILLNMNRASTVCILILIVIGLILTRTTQKLLPNLIYRLSDFDDCVKAYYGVENNSNGTTKINIFIANLLFSNVFLILDMLYGLYKFEFVQWYNVSNYLTYNIRSIIVFKFVAILNFSQNRFKQVNDLINRLDGKKNGGRGGKTGKIIISLAGKMDNRNNHEDKLKIEKIKNSMTMLRILHETLVDVCRDLSEAFGAFQAIGIITSLLNELENGFSIFVIVTNSDELTFCNEFFLILRSLLHMYIVGMTHFYFVFDSCDVVMKESFRSAILLNEYFLRTEFKDELLDNVKLFILQLKQNPVLFSAAGVFTLEWELMSDIVNEVCSYMFFFVQSTGYSFMVIQNIIQNQNLEKIEYRNMTTVGII